MSRTIKGGYAGSKDLWGKRPLAGETKSSYTKKKCRKIERQEGKQKQKALESEENKG